MLYSVIYVTVYFDFCFCILISNKNKNMDFKLAAGKSRRRGRKSKASSAGTAAAAAAVATAAHSSSSASLSSSSSSKGDAAATAAKNTLAIIFGTDEESVRKAKAKAAAEAAAAAVEAEAGPPKVIAMQASGLFTGATKYEDDVSGRPEAPSVQDAGTYSAMPVADFGAAMLRGMGWAPGKPVGGSVKAVVEPYVPDGRSGGGGRMGIGALQAMKEAAEKDAERKKGGNKRKGGAQQGHDGTGSAKRMRVEDSDALGGGGVGGGGAGDWLRTGIRVRVVDDTSLLAGGVHYSKKGVVHEVLPAPGGGLQCTLVMDSEQQRLEGVRGNWLSTALPKRGGQVVILIGEHRLQTGVLLQRDKSRQHATVQLDVDASTVVVGYDDLSELVFS